MKVTAGLMGGLKQVPMRVRELEDMGYDAALTAEIASDPFFPLLLAAEHSERIDIMTGIAVAFARSPMNLANIGHDLNDYSEGRFILGLGSQIKPHITRRFSMPWSKPAARMRELVLAMRAVWSCWYEGVPLDFRGEFYNHTLMTPMFTPENTEHGPPRVMLAAVGPLMTEVAAEVADGMIAHAFTTQRYMEEVSLPALEKGLVKAGRSRADFELVCPAFTVTGVDEQSFEASRSAVCQQIAFYGSTPAYKPVLELHGWGDLHHELHKLSKQGKWVEMGERITPEVLEEFAVVAEPAELPEKFLARFGHLLDVWMTTAQLPAEQQSSLLAALRA